MPGTDVSSLVGLIYEAALGADDCWIAFLRGLRDATRGCQAALFIQGFDGRPSRMLSLGDPELDRAYGEHYGAVNPWFTQGAHLVRPGAVVTSEWYPPEDLRRSEFYAGWLKPQGMFYAINGFVFDGPGCAGNLAVAKAWAKDGPGTDDVRLFETLMPHLQRAVEVQRRMAVPAHGTAAAAAFEMLPVAVLFLDAHRRVTYANSRASAIIAKRHALRLARGSELRVASGSQDAVFQRMLTNAIATATTGIGRPGGTLSVRSEDGSARLALTICPVRTKLLAFEGETVGAVVMIHDPSTRACPNRRSLREIFGLTEREAELASRLATGKKLADVAREMGIGREAAHTHLSRVLEKTDTHRQPELLRVLVLGCPLDVGDSSEREVM